MAVPKSRAKQFTCTTTDYVPGYQVVEILGVVTGSSVKAKHMGQDFLAGLRSVVGGTVSQYEDLLKKARASALSSMKAEARRLGASAVVNVRFATSMIAAGMSEVLAYGTAVRLAEE